MQAELLPLQREIQDADAQEHSFPGQNDLKDAHFHIQVVQRHRKFLRFAFGGKANQYKVLPFGLALAPRTFTKCMDAALAPQNPQLPGRLAYFSQLQGAGASSQGSSPSPPSHAWPPAEWPEERAHPSPAQQTIFLGVCLDSTSMQARLAPARVEYIQSCAARVKFSWHVSVGLCRRLLGLMVAASPVLPLGLLHMKPFLLGMKSLGMKSLGIRPSWLSLCLLKLSGTCFRKPFRVAGLQFSPEWSTYGGNLPSPNDNDGCFPLGVGTTGLRCLVR